MAGGTKGISDEEQRQKAGWAAVPPCCACWGLGGRAGADCAPLRLKPAQHGWIITSHS